MPGQYYLFVPFTKDELDKRMSDERSVKTIAQLWRQDSDWKYGKARKRPEIICYGDTLCDGWKLPGFSPEHDTIYIIGHCRRGGQDLSSSRAGFRFDRAQLDAETVVNRLLEYVPTEMINFKLFACFGGQINETGTSDDGSYLFDQSFAQRFYSRLKRRFPSAILSAYMLPVIAGLDVDGHKRLANEDGHGYWGRASGNRITFGA
ncbi:conserved protein of unknown function [Rhodovastum atsumiense]|uniref:Uncharacterized protein n=1 Tax=Rhodovastum atsumiense TaxID=504468 RepID=A0A5M6IWM9_9PROT|nr:hypothetical protein [Rhodovastum atsumiense]KAA5612723.1 hypothetical protein F1189_08280 [Rhodovastum atsumiense]CAH2602721.1 conserved protein of unknown function [Rhodovastum atsumiense]